MSRVDHGFSEEEQIHNGRSSISLNETTSPSRISMVFECSDGYRHLQNRRTYADHAAHSRW